MSRWNDCCRGSWISAGRQVGHTWNSILFNISLPSFCFVVFDSLKWEEKCFLHATVPGFRHGYYRGPVQIYQVLDHQIDRRPRIFWSSQGKNLLRFIRTCPFWVFPHGYWLGESFMRKKCAWCVDTGAEMPACSTCRRVTLKTNT